MEKIDAECWDSLFPVGSGLSSFNINFFECLVPLAVFGWVNLRWAAGCSDVVYQSRGSGYQTDNNFWLLFLKEREEKVNDESLPVWTSEWIWVRRNLERSWPEDSWLQVEELEKYSQDFKQESGIFSSSVPKGFTLTIGWYFSNKGKKFGTVGRREGKYCEGG